MGNPSIATSTPIFQGKAVDPDLSTLQGLNIYVVLNCLTGEHQTFGLQILRAGGRFCEIGKMDIYTNQSLPLLPFRRNISFFAIDIDRMQLEDPELLMTICREVFQRIADGSYKYIPYKKFTMDKIHEAIKLMKTGKHIGKVLLSNKNEDGSPVSVLADKKLRFDPGRPILVVGGAGGFGSQIIEWAVKLGARSFIVTTRPQNGGQATQKIKSMFRHLIESGCKIDAVEVDLSDSKDQEMLGALCLESDPTIQGIVLSVGIWETKGVYEMRNGDLESACDLKVGSAWHLHQVSLKMKNLNHFIMVGSFSSKILILHNMSVYGANNSILDAIAKHRKELGLPCKILQMSSLSDVGLLSADMKAFKYQKAWGAQFITSIRALIDLEALILSDEMESCHIQLFDGVLTAGPNFSSVFGSLTLGASMESKSFGSLEEIQQYLIGILMDITHSKDMDGSCALADTGLDSIGMTELAQHVLSDFGLNLINMGIAPHTTVSEFAKTLFKDHQSQQDDSITGNGTIDPLPPESTVQYIDTDKTVNNANGTFVSLGMHNNDE